MVGLLLVLAALGAEPPNTWALPRAKATDTAEAARVFRVGDIDNLGFGWPDGFDPFSGKQTPRHGYPWEPEPDDPDGTDRIMVVSSYVGEASSDGYTSSTSRPDNLPRTLVLDADLEGLTPRAIWLQFFVDDFQSVSYRSRYRVWFDGRRMPRLERLINALDQSGPIGRLVTFPLLPEEFGLLADGRLEVCMDDPETGAGDGFAFDFARVLVDPKAGGPRATVTGIARDGATGNGLPGVVIDAGGASTTTGTDGRFRLPDVIPGLVVVSASQSGFAQAVRATDLAAGAEVDLDLSLTPELASIGDQLARYGRVTLHGVHFPSGSDTIQADAGPVLTALRDTLQGSEEPVQVRGHTDSDGSEAYNLDLSKRRAAAVVAWLTSHGIERSRIDAAGLGEAQPIADNSTNSGKALNRRVEIVVGTALTGASDSRGAKAASDLPTCQPPR